MVTGVVVRNMRRFRGTGRGHWGAGVVVSIGICVGLGVRVVVTGVLG